MTVPSTRLGLHPGQNSLDVAILVRCVMAVHPLARKRG